MAGIEKEIRKLIKIAVITTAVALNSSEKPPSHAFTYPVNHDVSFLFDPTIGSQEKSVPTELTFDEIAGFALRMNRLHDMLPEYTVPIETNQDLVNWEEEIVPHFQEDGFISAALYPRNIQFQDMHAYVNDQLHIYGEDPLNTDAFTTCNVTSEYDEHPTRDIYVNDRFIHSQSSEYHAKKLLSVIIHETAHVEQGALCKMNLFFAGGLEESAQIATPEVEANMGMEGNKFALFSLVDYLRDMSMNAAKYLAMNDGSLMPQYLALTREVYRKPSEQAALAQVEYAVKGEEADHVAFLKYYNYDPLKRLLLAHKRNKDAVIDLKFSHTKVTMDDFGYFLDHAEQLISEYSKQ